MKKVMFVAMLAIGASALAGQTVGNPGGGIIKDGVYMTFGSAKVSVDPEPATVVPGTNLIRQVISQLALSEEQKGRIIQSFMPYGARKYYNVSKDKLDPQTRKKLIEEYAKITKQPVESIVLYAITEAGTRQTYLLPEFYNLSDEDQAAILFHEAYWIMKPSATYLEVVQTEIAFTRYLQAQKARSYDQQLGIKLAALFNDPKIAFNMDLKNDLQTFRVPGLPIFSIVSDATIICDYNSTDRSTSRITIKQNEELAFLYDVLEKQPTSLFIRDLVEFLSPDVNGSLGWLRMVVSSPNQIFSRGCYEGLKYSGIGFGKVSVHGREILIEVYEQ